MLEAFDVADIPYLRLLNMKLELREGRRVGVMSFAEHLVGNPTIPALHGGTLAGLLESIAHFELMAQTDEKAKIPKTITLTIDYLRSGKPRDTFAVAKVIKAGRRVATLHATAFQDDESQPIATAVVVLKVS
ncbi:MAG: PaaI family thioesterase [Archangium sp.]